MKKYTFKNEAGRNKLLCHLEDENIISSETYSELFTTCLTPSIIYGLSAIYNYIFVLNFSFGQNFLLITLLATKFHNFWFQY